MKKKQKLVRLVMFALFTALIVVLTFTPNLGYITIIPDLISITTLHIVVILGATILGPLYGAGLGGVWGILCLIKAFMEPILGNIPFQNPLVSVLPRIMVGLVAGIIVKALLKTKLPKAITIAIGSAVGTLTNTSLVILTLWLTNSLETYLGKLPLTIKNVYSVLIGINGIAELVVAVIIIPAVYIATEKIFSKQLKK